MKKVQKQLSKTKSFSKPPPWYRISVWWRGQLFVKNANKSFVGKLFWHRKSLHTEKTSNRTQWVYERAARLAEKKWKVVRWALRSITNSNPAHRAPPKVPDSERLGVPMALERVPVSTCERRGVPMALRRVAVGM